MPVGTNDLKFRVLAEVVGAQAVAGLKDAVDGVNKSAGFLSNAVKGLAAAFGAKELFEYGKGILETADQMGKLSQKTGIAVETLAGIEGAAALAGVPIESLTKGFTRLSVNLVEAANGNQELAGTYRNLGISIKDGDGNLKNGGEIIKDLADKFSKLKDGPEKAAVAFKLFGKSGPDWIPVLNQGSEAFDELGLAIDTDFANRATNFNDSIKKIGINIKNSAITNLKELLPTLQELGDAFGDFSKSGGDSIGFMDALGEAGRLLASAFVVSFTAIKEAIDGAITGFKEAKALLSGNSQEIDRLDAGLRARIAAADAAEDAFLKKATKNSLLVGDGTADQIRARQRSDTNSSTPKGGVNTDAIGENAKIIAQFEEKIAKLRAEASATDQSNASKERAVLLAELESKGISKSSDAYKNLAGEITTAVYALNVAKEKLAADNFTQKQNEEIELQKIQLDNYDKSSAEIQKLTLVKQLDNQEAEVTKKFTQEGKDAYHDATEAIKDQKLALIDLQEQQKQTFSVGASEALRDYLENARNVAGQVKDLFTHAFSNIEDALVDFVKTGKLNFAKFTDDILTDLIRIQVKALLVQGITGVSSLFSFGSASGSVAGGAADATAGGAGAGLETAVAANGGIMTAKGMVGLYARGGVATSPQMAIFGEGSSPEAYVPLPDGRSIPVSMKGNQGGTNVNVVVNVGNGGSDSSTSDSDKGTQLGKLIGIAVKNELVQQKRPGGLLA